LPVSKKARRWIVTSVFAAVAIVVLGVVFRPTGIPVDHATVDRGLLEVTVEEQGRTRARYRYTVAAPVTGRLLRTEVDEGDVVKTGAELTRISPPPEDSRSAKTLFAQLSAAEARRTEASAQLAEAESNLVLALDDAKRRVELFDRGLVSIEERDHYAKAADAAKARVDSASASLSAAEASVESARARLIGIDGSSESDEFTAVIAPISGTVLRVFEESERVVPAGAPLFELSRGSELEIIVDYLTQDAVKVDPGDVIKITGWGGDETLLGEVRYVEPGAFTKISTLGVEEQRVNVIGDFLDAPTSLGAGFRVEAAVIVWAGENVLRIPTTAIFRREGEWHTFVVDENRAHLQRIEIAHRGRDFAEVVSGVAEDDVIIAFPSDLIEDGVRVAIGR